jgi:hypothetical protein
MHAPSRRSFGFLLAMSLAAPLPLVPAGCGDLSYLLGAPVTRVVLRNKGDFPVRLTLYIGSRSDMSEAELKATGERLSFTIPDGDSRTFIRDCVNFQAIFIDDAELEVVGDDGPNTSTDVLRAGTDFHCRSSIEFIFDHSDAVFDFDVTTSVHDDPYNPGGSP